MTAMPPTPLVTGFHEKRSGSIQYVVAEPGSGHCAIIDPVLDFDPCSGATATRSADAILAHIRAQGLTVDWILDTHPHADHFSAAAYLKAATGAPIGIGERITDVQRLWQKLYNLPESFRTDGSQWDRLFADGESFRIGGMDVGVLFSPGHTMASVTYLAGDAAFIHDTLFMPDSGTARADFPGADAAQLWRSIQRIIALPENTRLFTGHDYEPGGRAAAWESSIAEQCAGNAYLLEQTEESFVAKRNARDSTLPIPKLMLAALQVNIAGGRLPEPENNGCRYLKIPLDALGGAAPWG
jgi:glyoxylase-like metal-dependent hydrolase (beta-lactamase superfamily II)